MHPFFVLDAHPEKQPQVLHYAYPMIAPRSWSPLRAPFRMTPRFVRES